MRSISNQGYVTIPKEDYTTHPLPSNAADFRILIKNNNQACRIDIRHSHTPGLGTETFAEKDANLYNNLYGVTGDKYATVSLSDNTLPYLGYQLESGAEPEWVRIYYRLT